MSDVKEITTPSGKKVILRNYTTHGDDLEARALMSEATFIQGADGEPQMSVSMNATTAARDRYVELLVQSIDGSADDIVGQLKAMRSEDYAAISDEVTKITSVDPKANSES